MCRAASLIVESGTGREGPWWSAAAGGAGYDVPRSACEASRHGLDRQTVTSDSLPYTKQAVDLVVLSVASASPNHRSGEAFFAHRKGHRLWTVSDNHCQEILKDALLTPRMRQSRRAPEAENQSRKGGDCPPRGSNPVGACERRACQNQATC